MITSGQRMVKEGFLMLKMMKDMLRYNCLVLQTQRLGPSTFLITPRTVI
jgi:hypothetical protein